MRYELKLDRHHLRACIVVRCHLNRYSWDLHFSGRDFTIRFGTPRLYKHAEVALYDALKYAKQHILRFTAVQQRVLMLWLRQVFDNAWLPVPMNQRLSRLTEDRVKPTPCFERQIQAHQAQPVSQQLDILASMDNAGMRTRMCPSTRVSTAVTQPPTNTLDLALAS